MIVELYVVDYKGITLASIFHFVALKFSENKITIISANDVPNRLQATMSLARFRRQIAEFGQYKTRIWGVRLNIRPLTTTTLIPGRNRIELGPSSLLLGWIRSIETEYPTSKFGRIK